MEIYAIIRDGIVINTVVIAPGSDWQPPEGCTMLPVAEAADMPRETVPEPVPEAITPRQLRLALLQRGLLANVEAAVNALPEPKRTGALIEWEYSSQFLRTHPMVAAIAGALQISSETLDEIFVEGAGF
jgi:hypothetical protein